MQVAIAGTQIDPKAMDELVLRTLGPGADQYLGSFRTGYQRAGQDTDPNLEATVKAKGATFSHDFARDFIRGYQKKFGKFPEPQEIEKFLGDKMDSGLAFKEITGGVAPGARINLVDEYLTDMPGAESKPLVNNEPGQTISDPQVKYLSQMLEGQLSEGIGDIEDVFGRERGRAIDEAGAFSRQPNFRQVLSDVDTRKGNALSDLIGNVRTKGAELGFGAEERAREFGTTTGLQKEGLDLQRKSLSSQIRGMSEDREREDLCRVREERLSDRLGRLQADSGGSDALDWAELGVNVAGLAAAPFTGGASLLAGPAFSAGKKGAKMASPD